MGPGVALERASRQVRAGNWRPAPGGARLQVHVGGRVVLVETGPWGKRAPLDVKAGAAPGMRPMAARAWHGFAGLVGPRPGRFIALEASRRIVEQALPSAFGRDPPSL